MMKELLKKSEEDLGNLYTYALTHENLKLANAIKVIQQFYNKEVLVIKGKKVPIGTSGICFWIGYKNYHKGCPLDGTFPVGIKTDDGTIWWTYASNLIPVIQKQ